MFHRHPLHIEQVMMFCWFCVRMCWWHVDVLKFWLFFYWFFSDKKYIFGWCRKRCWHIVYEILIFWKKNVYFSFIFCRCPQLSWSTFNCPCHCSCTQYFSEVSMYRHARKIPPLGSLWPRRGEFTQQPSHFLLLVITSATFKKCLNSNLRTTFLKCEKKWDSP